MSDLETPVPPGSELFPRWIIHGNVILVDILVLYLGLFISEFYYPLLTKYSCSKLYAILDFFRKIFPPFQIICCSDFLIYLFCYVSRHILYLDTYRYIKKVKTIYNLKRREYL
jgi:hypothetical protein